MTRFRMNTRGVGQLLRSPMIEAEMLRRATRIREAAEAASPVGDAARDPHPGLYKSSWHTASHRRGGRKRDRATAIVWNSAPYARWVEYGTEQRPGQHVLLRAALTAGGE